MCQKNRTWDLRPEPWNPHLASVPASCVTQSLWVSISSSVKWKGRWCGHPAWQDKWVCRTLVLQDELGAHSYSPLVVLVGVHNWNNAVARMSLSQRPSFFASASELSGLCKVQELLAGFYPCLEKCLPADQSRYPIIFLVLYVWFLKCREGQWLLSIELAAISPPEQLWTLWLLSVPQFPHQPNGANAI